MSLRICLPRSSPVLFLVGLLTSIEVSAVSTEPGHTDLASFLEGHAEAIDVRPQGHLALKRQRLIRSDSGSIEHHHKPETRELRHSGHVSHVSKTRATHSQKQASDSTAFDEQALGSTLQHVAKQTSDRMAPPVGALPEDVQSHQQALAKQAPLQQQSSVRPLSDQIQFVSMEEATAAAASAAITAAHVAESLPASLPISVRKATLEAAASAAVKASLEEDLRVSARSDKPEVTAIAAGEAEEDLQVAAHQDKLEAAAADAREAEEDLQVAARKDEFEAAAVAEEAAAPAASEAKEDPQVAVRKANEQAENLAPLADLPNPAQVLIRTEKVAMPRSRGHSVPKPSVEQDIGHQAPELSSSFTSSPSAVETDRTQQSSDHTLDLHKAMATQAVNKRISLDAKSIEGDTNAKAPLRDRLLYVGVFSKPEDFERRESMRTDWISALKAMYADEPGKVLAEFIIGRKPLKAAAASAGQSVVEQRQSGSAKTAVDSKMSQLDYSLGREYEANRDLFHVPYEELPVNVLMFFAHAVEMRYRFVMKVDIDQEFLFRPLIPALNKEDLDVLLYSGQTLKDVSLLEAKASKGKESQAEKYFAGPCYLTSWSLAQRISKTHLDHSIMLWSYNTAGSDVDDMDMGQWVAYEDKLLQTLVREKRKRIEEDANANQVKRVDYRIMDICRTPLPTTAPNDEALDPSGDV